MLCVVLIALFLPPHPTPPPLLLLAVILFHPVVLVVLVVVLLLLLLLLLVLNPLLVLNLLLRLSLLLPALLLMLLLRLLLLLLRLLKLLLLTLRLWQRLRGHRGREVKVVLGMRAYARTTPNPHGATHLRTTCLVRKHASPFQVTLIAVVRAAGGKACGGAAITARHGRISLGHDGRSVVAKGNRGR